MPHCDFEKYIKHVKEKGGQRYICKNCKRTFTPFTGTWLANIHKKDLLCDYILLMQGQLSLQKIAKKMDISKNTSLDWRHRKLSSIEELSSACFSYSSRSSR